VPELPEVETIVRELNSVLPGRRMESVRVFRDNALGGVPVTRFRRGLEGSRVNGVTRRGKFLLLALERDTPPGPGLLVAHLRMTGKFITSPPLASPGPHHRVWFEMDDQTLLIFQDLRCFGTLKLVAREQDDPALSRLGMEPLSRGFTANRLGEGLSASRTPLKHWLMDQAKVAGLGNIYVAEILHQAQLSPLRPANGVNPGEVKRLHGAIRNVLQRAIRKNGTTISDFRRVDDKTGSFQNFLQVYGKAGQPCPVCRTPIARIRQQQRSTFFCPTCQI